MLALGLVFILVSAAVMVGAIYDGGEPASVELFGQTISTTIAGVFIAGAATMLVFLLGVWLLMGALSRSRRKRHERKDASKRQQESVSQLDEERAQLRAENERLQERVARESRPAPMPSTTGTTGTTSTPVVVDHSDSTPPSDTDVKASDTDVKASDTDLRDPQKASGSTPGHRRDES